eukprot:TRINITY_DN11832_c0_g1_i2.p1 TRINITY_DN11832_c0_g1~~TRINITY_DN11832_c0_g1_i2.p1  ORF type:complete len:350 (+),score=73.28 TRINITY_DN11832_c0_g1_i2:129-1178(+)
MSSSAKATPCRPAPLLLPALPQPEAPVQQRRLPEWCCEVPVRRTFIDYRCFDESPRLSLSRSLSGLSTAPASLAGSVRESLDEVVSTPVWSPRGLVHSHAVAPAEADTGSAASSARRSSASTASTSQPLMTYQMSPISARAAGLMQEQQSSSRRSEASPLQEEQPSSLLRSEALPQQEEAIASNGEGGVVRRSARWCSDEEDSSGDEDDEEEDLVLCPVYTEGAALPSVGSAGHGDGTCRRCCFFPKGRCNNGEDCQFCHFAHEKRRNKGTKKKKSKKRTRRAGGGRKGLGPQAPQSVGAVEQSPDSSPGKGSPVAIVLQDAIPQESSAVQTPSYAMAFVPVPFCVGVY